MVARIHNHVGETTMKTKPLVDLKSFAHNKKATEAFDADLESQPGDSTSITWTEEYAASGGGDKTQEPTTQGPP